MRVAVVTGATSGIGRAITKMLLRSGIKVYGIGRDFSKLKIEDNNFIKVECDLKRYQNIESSVEWIKKRDKIDILINSAGVGYFAPHEEIAPYKLHNMIAINLEAPLILTQLFLRDLKEREGYIINISSITAKKSSVFGAGYSATKAGLTHFSKSLFDEVRKRGVKVITIHPDITKTEFYNDLNFREGESEDSYILPECVSRAVEDILTQRIGTVITDITIQPQRHMIRKK